MVPRGNVGCKKKFQTHAEPINLLQSIVGLLRPTAAMRKLGHHELVEVTPLLMVSSWAKILFPEP